MARLTAPSQWLPGFDPEPPETPAADIEPALTPLAAAAVSELAEDADESTSDPIHPRATGASTPAPPTRLKHGRFGRS